MSDPSGNPSASGNARLDQVIAEYLQAVEEGRTLSREHLLDLHPDLADELQEFFSGHDQMMGLASARLSPADSAPRPADDTLECQTSAELRKRAISADASQPRDKIESLDATVGALRRFGDYEILEEIARGGMGVVYKARQISLNRVVALKMILAGQLASEEDVRRFRTEAEAAAHLDHPGIVPIHDVGQHKGHHYFSMGFVDGPSLSERLGDGPLPPREAAEITQKIADAVAYAHAQGVIHRDLKPANILLREDKGSSTNDSISDRSSTVIDTAYHPKITDFGLAKISGGDLGLTSAGQVLGTPSYMPPEQASGRISDINESSDIYSIGAILYSLLTGQPPFQADHHLDVLIQVIEQEAKSPRELVSKVPRDLNTICLKCLSKDPQLRYDSAQSLADDLLRFLHGEPIEAKSLGLTGRLVRWAKSHPALAVTWTALAVFYLIHLICLWGLRLPGEGGALHWTLTGLTVAWAACAWTCQRLMLYPRLQATVPKVWVAMDVVMFTGVLAAANGPSSPLVIGYLLLVAGAALRFRIQLVWQVAILSILGYIGLVLDARWHRPEIVVEPHAPLYFVVSLVVMGLIMHLVLRRVRALAPGPRESLRDG